MHEENTQDHTATVIQHRAGKAGIAECPHLLEGVLLSWKYTRRISENGASPTLFKDQELTVLVFAVFQVLV